MSKKSNLKNSVNSNRRKLLAFAGAAGAGALLSPLLSKASPSTIIEAGSNVDTASYVIFQDSGTTYSKNGTTGKIEFQGADANTVIQSSINALTNGTIVIKDINPSSVAFTPKDKVTLVFNYSGIVTNGQYASSKYTTTTTLNWNNGNVQYISLASGAQTFTFSNPIDGGRYALILKQPASGAAGTVTYPSNVLWPSSAAPVLTTTNSKVDIVGFIYDGTNGKYYGSSSMNY